MFSGFSPETIAFFTALRFNNNRPFFEENRPVYEAAVRKPLIELAETLAPTVQAIDPQMDIRPARTVSRIHRDLRFRKDKTPYRDYMWLGFRHVGESREETCGFYFDISAESAHWGCGYFHMQAEIMQTLRTLMVKEPKRILKILKDPAFAQRFAVMGENYVRQHRPPEGMDPMLAAIYPRKSLYAEHAIASMEELYAPALAETIAEDFKALAPFYKLMRECMVRRIEEAQP